MSRLSASGPRRSFLRRLRGARAAALALAALATLAVGLPAAAQAVVLVSNFGHTGTAGNVNLAAQNVVGIFTTGGSDATLNSIEFKLSQLVPNTVAPTVKLYAVTVAGRQATQGTEAATLITPSTSLTTSTFQTFTYAAPSGTILTASTKYIFVLEPPSAGLVVVQTTTDRSEDAGEAGWTIDGSSSGTSPYYIAAVAQIVVRVNGTLTTNDAPTADDNTVTTDAGTAYTFTATDFGFADADGDTLASVKIVIVPTPGTLALDGTAVLADAVVTKAQIDGGMLIFTPVAGASGNGYASFDFKVNDGTVDSDDAYTMTINVTPTNNAPVFSSSNVSRSIAENTAAGQDVGAAVTATDADTGDTLIYTLGGADMASFDIVEASGQIRTKAGVSYDHEAKSSYTVTVTASDGTATADADVTINITDVDEPPDAPATPMVSAVSGSTTSLSVSWIAPANDGKPAIASYDVQYRVSGTAAWTDGPEDVTGTTTPVSGLTANTLYEAQVRATNAEGDSGWSDPPGSGRTNAPTNNAPVFNPSNVSRSIEENTAAGQNVGAVVTATDVDGDTLSYTLGGADMASFDFVGTTGQIRTKANVSYDHEAKPSYTVTVTASDGTDSAVAGVTISVTDVAEPPDAPATPTVSAVPDSTTSLTVSWDAPANAGKPDIDSYDVQYRVTGSGAWTDGPQDVTTTTTTTTTTISGLTANTQYQVQVHATNDEGDSGWSAPPGSGRTNAPDNNAPVFNPSNVSRSIAENTAAGENVGAVVTATDADNDTLTYTLGGADMASFDIVETSGQIRTKSGVSYDHEAKASYTVTVTATDTSSATAVANVTISITDVAEPPVVERPVTEPPDAPAMPTVSAVAGSTTSLTVSWTTPANAGKPPIASYDVQYRVDSSGTWTDGPQDVTGTTTTVTGLVADTLYEARVRATNADGDSGWSDPPVSGRTNATTNTAAAGAPTITGTAHVGESLTAATTGIMDADGLASPGYTYQWIRVNGTEADIAGANSSTYILVDADLGKTIKVRVTFDDDGGNTETLTSEATAAPVQAADIDPSGLVSAEVPGTTLVRIGRTVGSQVVDALGQRLGGGQASHVTVAGVPLTGGAAPVPEDKADDAFGLSEWAKRARREEEARTITADDLLLRSAFHLSSGGREAGGPAITTWGRVSTGGFDAEVDDVTIDGDVTTGLLGFDAEWDNLLAGVMLSQSEGEGAYRLDPAQGSDVGTVKSDLTGVYPYARINLNDRVSAWGLAGAGSGKVTLKRDAGESMKTDLSMRMGALGVQGQVLDGTGPSGMRLDLKSDAMWVGTKSARSADMAGTQGNVLRLRLVAQGERDFVLAEQGTLTPSAELGLRHDDGDAETGVGVEFGAGLRYMVGSFTIEARARTLVAHEASGYEEWGASAAVRLTPGASGRGLSLSIAPTWGRTGSASEWPWSARDAGEFEGGGGFEADGRIEAQMGYGFALPRNRGLLTPYGALTLGSEGGRTVRGGARWMLDSDVAVTLDATRTESAGAEAENEVRVQRGAALLSRRRNRPDQDGGRSCRSGEPKASPDIAPRPSSRMTLRQSGLSGAPSSDIGPHPSAATTAPIVLTNSTLGERHDR